MTIILPKLEIIPNNIHHQTSIQIFKFPGCLFVMFDSATPWTVGCQAPLSMGFPKQGYWSGVPFPSPGDLPNPGIEPAPPALAGRFFTTAPPGNPCFNKNPDKLMLYNLLIYPLNLFLKKKIVF